METVFQGNLGCGGTLLITRVGDGYNVCTGVEGSVERVLQAEELIVALALRLTLQASKAESLPPIVQDQRGAVGISVLRSLKQALALLEQYPVVDDSTEDRIFASIGDLKCLISQVRSHP